MSSAMPTCVAGLEAGALDGAHQRFQRLLVGVEGRPPAAFVGHAGQRAGLLHQLAGGAIDLRGPVQRLGEAVRAGAHHHEVLDVHPPPGMRAAAEDLDLRQRHQPGVRPAQVAVQRHAGRRRRGMRGGHRHRQDRVGAQAATCWASRPARSAAGPAPPGPTTSMPVTASAIAPLTFCHRAPHVVAAERVAAVAQVQRLAACRWTRPPARSRGRRRRPPAARRPPPWAGRGCPTRGGRARRRCWCRSCGEVPCPCLADVAQPVAAGRAAGRARRGARGPGPRLR